MLILKCIDSAVDLNEVSNGPKDFQRTQKQHSTQAATCNKLHHHHPPPTTQSTHSTQYSTVPYLLRDALHSFNSNQHPNTSSTMADEDEIAALVIDNGSGMCKGGLNNDDDFRGRCRCCCGEGGQII